jgi:hypothetical protein
MAKNGVFRVCTCFDAIRTYCFRINDFQKIKKSGYERGEAGPAATGATRGGFPGPWPRA